MSVIECEIKGREVYCPECGRANPDVCKRVEDGVSMSVAPDLTGTSALADDTTATADADPKVTIENGAMRITEMDGEPDVLPKVKRAKKEVAA